MSGTTSVLQRAVRRCRRGFLAAVLFSFFINLLMLTAPLYMLQIFDRVLTSRSTDTLIYLTAMAAAALLALSLLEFARSRLLARIGLWLDRTLGPSVLATTLTSDAVSRKESASQRLYDLAVVRNLFAGQTVTVAMDAPWTPIFVLALFLLHPLLGWLVLGGAVVLLGLAVANEFAIAEPTRIAEGRFADGLQWARSSERNTHIIQAMGMMPAVSDRWSQGHFEALALQDRANGRNESIKSLTRFIRYFLQVAVLGVGAWLTLDGSLTAGGMIAGSILTGRALLPVDRSIAAWRAAISARNAYRRLKALLAGVDDSEEAMSLPTPRGHVSAEAIMYVHPGSDTPALSRINFALEPGECLGIIGPTGAGKSTLARLLVGIVRPQAGKVRLDGMELSNWSQDDRAKYVGYLPQDVGLFSGTVRANIARLVAAESDQVVAAAERAGAHELILRLPKSYDTELGEAGSGLSAGQQQRIGLARSLFGSPRLIVLDEPNANLDQDGEAALLGTLGRLKADGITTIIIAHRPNVLRQADKILVLHGGAVQMFAPRDEVFKKMFAPRRKIAGQAQMVLSDA